jgi:hypothetical protein
MLRRISVTYGDGDEAVRLVVTVEMLDDGAWEEVKIETDDCDANLIPLLQSMAMSDGWAAYQELMDLVDNGVDQVMNEQYERSRR